MGDLEDIFRESGYDPTTSEYIIRLDAEDVDDPEFIDDEFEDEFALDEFSDDFDSDFD